MVPAHAGTLDVDIVIDLQILTDTEAYHTLAVAFRNERAGKHGTVIEASIAILRSRFAGDEKTEGYRKDGPVSVAKFELGADAELREARALRQRQASDVIEHLLVRIG
jgi:hypothetical protein